MTIPLLQESGILYGPILISSLLFLMGPLPQKALAGLCFSFLTVLSMTILINPFMAWAWDMKRNSLFGLHPAAWIGWAILWGIAAPLTLTRLAQNLLSVPLSFGTTILIFASLDFIFMPLFPQVIQLDSRWIIGDLITLLLIFIPALLLFHTTVARTHLSYRALVIAGTFTSLLFALPLILISSAQDYSQIAQMIEHLNPAQRTGIWIATITGALPGCAAASEFYRQGKGTPVPFDPPTHLVTSGVYRYLRNPMQLSITSLLIIQAIALQRQEPLILALIGFCYSIGLAKWSEHEDLKKRFGNTWANYQKKSRSWIPYWNPPLPAPQAVIFVDQTCQNCSALGEWTSNSFPNIKIKPANQYEYGKLLRLCYRDLNTKEEWYGTSALARCFMHKHLGWAFIAWFMLLPGFSWLLNQCFDVSGLRNDNKQKEPLIK